MICNPVIQGGASKPTTLVEVSEEEFLQSKGGNFTGIVIVSDGSYSVEIPLALFEYTSEYKLLFDQVVVLDLYENVINIVDFRDGNPMFSINLNTAQVINDNGFNVLYYIYK